MRHHFKVFSSSHLKLVLKVQVILLIKQGILNPSIAKNNFIYLCRTELLCFERLIGNQHVNYLALVIFPCYRLEKLKAWGATFF